MSDEETLARDNPVTATPIAPGNTIRVHRDQLPIDGVVVRLDDDGVVVRSKGATEPIAISWQGIRKIALLARKPREWGGILGFAVAGGLVLGRVGWMLESLNDSGVRQPGAMGTGAAFGALLGALFASLIAFAKPREGWVVVYEAPRTDAPGTHVVVPLGQRLEEGARCAAQTAGSAKHRRWQESGVAWVLLVLFLVALVALAGTALNRVDFR